VGENPLGFAIYDWRLTRELVLECLKAGRTRAVRKSEIIYRK
jgi:hypothetical protein